MNSNFKKLLSDKGFIETSCNHFHVSTLKNSYNRLEVFMNPQGLYQVNITDDEFNIKEEYILENEEEVLHLLNN
jgi:hypothetical protein